MNRRELLKASAVTGALSFVGPKRSVRTESSVTGSIVDVAGIRVGHFTDTRRPTGCTVLLIDGAAVAGVDVRGGAPGSRETDLLRSEMSSTEVHAILLSGGSSFGLDAASGVVKFLEERSIGIQTRAMRIPIVPAAILYDLLLGDPKIRPDAQAGYKACEAASTVTPQEGNFGAGAGATVGKLYGIERAMKGGIGNASITIRGSNGLTVGAIAAVNAIGDVIDPSSGRIIAGVRSVDGRSIAGGMTAIRSGGPIPPLMGGTSTTLAVVATDAILSKAQANKVAQMAQDGLARAINPAHTPGDGDTVFALATGKTGREGNVTLIGALAAEVVAMAIVNGVRAAKPVLGIPSASSFETK